jgi:hypothetical protein
MKPPSAPPMKTTSLLVFLLSLLFFLFFDKSKHLAVPAAVTLLQKILMMLWDHSAFNSRSL